jgi:AAA+ ATPase superfamily predicted ATPase
VRYRLCDNYARFYLKYVEPNIEEIKDGKFEFEQIPELKNWQTIMGLAFENLVLNHVLDFKDALHLGGVQIRAAAPFSKSGKGGVQIDLLIQTDDAMYVDAWNAVECEAQKDILYDYKRIETYRRNRNGPGGTVAGCCLRRDVQGGY